MWIFHVCLCEIFVQYSLSCPFENLVPYFTICLLFVSDKLKTQESSLKSCNDQLASAKTELNQTTERHKRVADDLGN